MKQQQHVCTERPIREATLGYLWTFQCVSRGKYRRFVTNTDEDTDRTDASPDNNEIKLENTKL